MHSVVEFVENFGVGSRVDSEVGFEGDSEEDSGASGDSEVGFEEDSVVHHRLWVVMEPDCC